MAPEVALAPAVEPVEETEIESATEKQNGQRKTSTIGRSISQAPDNYTGLPTFPEEVGWREVVDPERGISQRVPLTLLDILFPTEKDIGVVVMGQSRSHDSLSRQLTTMIENHLGKSWLSMHDVFVYWPYQDTPPAAPDITVIHGGREPEEGNNSYVVGRDGPLPSFVAEITSKASRQADLDNKPIYYAAVGVKESLIIDIQTETTEDWQLIGYRLGKGPYYDPIEPDADGGLTFETIGSRFVAVGRERIEVYDSTTGKRLLTPEEQIERAERYAAKLRELGIDVD